MFRRSLSAAVVMTALLMFPRLIAGKETVSLAASLRQLTSTPIYLVQGEQGLCVGSMDGRVKKTLVQGPVCTAIYDGGTEVIFFPRDRKLWVFDLREPAPQPVAVMQLLPPRQAGSIPKRECWDYAVSMPDGFTYATNSEAISIDLGWRSQRILLEAGKASIVGTWLRDHQDRPIRKRPTRETISSAHPSPFGKTGMNLVYYQTPNADSGRCLLTNQKGQFFRPQELREVWIPETGQPNCYPSRTTFQFDANQQAWPGDEGPCTAQACIKLKKTDSFVGWLDPGPKLYFEGYAP